MSIPPPPQRQQQQRHRPSLVSLDVLQTATAKGASGVSSVSAYLTHLTAPDAQYPPLVSQIAICHAFAHIPLSVSLSEILPLFQSIINAFSPHSVKHVTRRLCHAINSRLSTSVHDDFIAFIIHLPHALRITVLSALVKAHIHHSSSSSQSTNPAFFDSLHAKLRHTFGPRAAARVLPACSSALVNSELHSTRPIPSIDLSWKSLQLVHGDALRSFIVHSIQALPLSKRTRMSAWNALIEKNLELFLQDPDALLSLYEREIIEVQREVDVGNIHVPDGVVHALRKIGSVQKTCAFLERHPSVARAILTRSNYCNTYVYSNALRKPDASERVVKLRGDSHYSDYYYQQAKGSSRPTVDSLIRKTLRDADEQTRKSLFSYAHKLGVNKDDVVVLLKFVPPKSRWPLLRESNICPTIDSISSSWIEDDSFMMLIPTQDRFDIVKQLSGRNVRHPYLFRMACGKFGSPDFSFRTLIGFHKTNDKHKRFEVVDAIVINGGLSRDAEYALKILGFITTRVKRDRKFVRDSALNALSSNAWSIETWIKVFDDRNQQKVEEYLDKLLTYSISLREAQAELSNWMKIICKLMCIASKCKKEENKNIINWIVRALRRILTTDDGLRASAMTELRYSTYPTEYSYDVLHTLWNEVIQPLLINSCITESNTKKHPFNWSCIDDSMDVFFKPLVFGHCRRHLSEVEISNFHGLLDDVINALTADVKKHFVDKTTNKITNSMKAAVGGLIMLSLEHSDFSKRDAYAKQFVSSDPSLLHVDTLWRYVSKHMPQLLSCENDTLFGEDTVMTKGLWRENGEPFMPGCVTFVKRWAPQLERIVKKHYMRLFTKSMKKWNKYNANMLAGFYSITVEDVRIIVQDYIKLCADKEDDEEAGEEDEDEEDEEEEELEDTPPHTQHSGRRITDIGSMVLSTEEPVAQMPIPEIPAHTPFVPPLPPPSPPVFESEEMMRPVSGDDDDEDDDEDDEDDDAMDISQEEMAVETFEYPDAFKFINDVPGFQQQELLRAISKIPVRCIDEIKSRFELYMSIAHEEDRFSLFTRTSLLRFLGMYRFDVSAEMLKEQLELRNKEKLVGGRVFFLKLLVHIAMSGEYVDMKTGMNLTYDAMKTDRNAWSNDRTKMKPTILHHDVKCKMLMKCVRTLLSDTPDWIWSLMDEEMSTQSVSVISDYITTLESVGEYRPVTMKAIEKMRSIASKQPRQFELHVQTVSAILSLMKNYDTADVVVAEMMGVAKVQGTAKKKKIEDNVAQFVMSLISNVVRDELTNERYALQVCQSLCELTSFATTRATTTATSGDSGTSASSSISDNNQTNEWIIEETCNLIAFLIEKVKKEQDVIPTANKGTDMQFQRRLKVVVDEISSQHETKNPYLISKVLDKLDNSDNIGVIAIGLKLRINAIPWSSTSTATVAATTITRHIFDIMEQATLHSLELWAIGSILDEFINLEHTVRPYVQELILEVAKHDSHYAWRIAIGMLSYAGTWTNWSTESRTLLKRLRNCGSSDVVVAAMEIVVP